jgi:hypothetical protein
VGAPDRADRRPKKRYTDGGPGGGYAVWGPGTRRAQLETGAGGGRGPGAERSGSRPPLRAKPRNAYRPRSGSTRAVAAYRLKNNNPDPANPPGPPCKRSRAPAQNGYGGDGRAGTGHPAATGRARAEGAAGARGRESRLVRGPGGDGRGARARPGTRGVEPAFDSRPPTESTGRPADRQRPASLAGGAAGGSEWWRKPEGVGARARGGGPRRSVTGTEAGARQNGRGTRTRRVASRRGERRAEEGGSGGGGRRAGRTRGGELMAGVGWAGAVDGSE